MGGGQDVVPNPVEKCADCGKEMTETADQFTDDDKRASLKTKIRQEYKAFKTPKERMALKKAHSSYAITKNKNSKSTNYLA